MRVGVNAAMVHQAGLVRLLIDAGIITEEQYTHAMANEMERERDRYAEELSRRLGRQVDLA